MNKDNKFRFGIRQKINELATATTVDVDIYGVVVNGDTYWSDEVGNLTVLKQLQGLSANQDIILHINSVGGEVASGVSIYNRLKALPNKKSVIIEGLAASIASIIAMVGDEIHMALGSELMIHNPRTCVFGEEPDMRKAADSLAVTKESLIDIYQAKTGLDRDVLSELMDNETWLGAGEAYDKGFCTSIDESLQMVACVNGTNLVVNGTAIGVEHLKGLPIDIYDVVTEGDPMEETTVVTVDVLREEHADIYNEIFRAGAQAERERIKDLDAISNVDRAEVIHRAKYETLSSANEVALELLKATPTNHLGNYLSDAAVSNKVDTVPEQGTHEPDEMTETMALVDRVMQSRLKQ